MRPIRRGEIPLSAPYKEYSDARADLVSRLGRYCSYCEREIATVLAVEHIQPKGLPAYAHLELEWSNFLLACVNCNSTKKDKDVVLLDVLLPDRDNTLVPFKYSDSGSIEINANVLGTPLEAKAKKIINLTGLDKRYSKVVDSNGNAVSLDRISQRIEALGEARHALGLYDAQPTNEMAEMIIMLAKAKGYFSIWYQVFEGVPKVLRQLVVAFPGTSASGCFSGANAEIIVPSPNPDGLPCGGKA